MWKEERLIYVKEESSMYMSQIEHFYTSLIVLPALASLEQKYESNQKAYIKTKEWTWSMELTFDRISRGTHEIANNMTVHNGEEPGFCFLTSRIKILF